MEPLRENDPRKIGGYRILARLGSGGMGRVYLARSPGIRQAALKVVHAHLAHSPEFRARFAREVAAAQQVGGAYTAAVLAADPHAPQPWLATEYLPGPTLETAVREGGPLTARGFRTLAAALAEALEAVHRAGLVHRDLKPANIILASDGPRVIDFGIAKDTGATDITGTGQGMGTPAFLAPEQAQGREPTPKTDVFALGAVLAYAGTGTAPFGTEPAATVLYRVVHESPRVEGLSDHWRDLVASCLHKDPERRPDVRTVLRAAGGPPEGQGRSEQTAFTAEREGTTLIPSGADRTESRGRRIARHPAAWIGGPLAAAVAAAIALHNMPLGFGYSEADIAVDPAAPAAVLEPALSTPLGIEPFNAEGASGISLGGRHFAHWARPGRPLVIADLDEPGALVAEDDVPEPEAALTGIAVSDTSEQVVALREDGGFTTWYPGHPIHEEPQHRSGGEGNRHTVVVVGPDVWDRAYAYTSPESEEGPDLGGLGGSVSMRWDGRYVGFRHATRIDSFGIPVTTLATDRNARFFASAGEDLTVELRRFPRAIRAFLRVGRDTVMAAESMPTEEAPDGTRGTPDEPEARTMAVTALAVGPGGEHVAFALGDMAYLWDTSTEEPDPLPRAHGDADMDAVAISPAGELVAASGREGAINIWHVRTGHRLATMAKPEGSAPLAFTDDGRTLRAVTAEGTLLEWDLTELAGR